MLLALFCFIHFVLSLFYFFLFLQVLGELRYLLIPPKFEVVAQIPSTVTNEEILAVFRSFGSILCIRPGTLKYMSCVIQSENNILF
jgi:hypothetical protein